MEPKEPGGNSGGKRVRKANSIYADFSMDKVYYHKDKDLLLHFLRMMSNVVILINNNKLKRTHNPTSYYYIYVYNYLLLLFYLFVLFILFIYLFICILLWSIKQIYYFFIFDTSNNNIKLHLPFILLFLSTAYQLIDYNNIFLFLF